MIDPSYPFSIYYYLNNISMESAKTTLKFIINFHFQQEYIHHMI